MACVTYGFELDTEFNLVELAKKLEEKHSQHNISILDGDYFGTIFNLFEFESNKTISDLEDENDMLGEISSSNLVGSCNIYGIEFDDCSKFFNRILEARGKQSTLISTLFTVEFTFFSIDFFQLFVTTLISFQ